MHACKLVFTLNEEIITILSVKTRLEEKETLVKHTYSHKIAKNI